MPRCIVVPSKVSDLYRLADNLRDNDKAEIEALGVSAKTGLRMSFRNAILRKTYFVDGEIAAMSGLCGAMLDDKGEPYLVTSSVAERMPITFVKEARKSVQEMLAHRTYLEGYVAADYSQACGLLETLGFTLDLPEQRGSKRFRRYHASRYEVEERSQQTKVFRPGAKFSPFIIYTAGRSRTAWLSSFLTYGKATCYNEIAIRLRNMSDVVQLLSNTGIGSAETAVAPAWQLIKHHVPQIKSVVVRRPLEEIIASFARSEVANIASIDEERLRQIIAYENRCLEKISAQPDTLTVDFCDMENVETCERIFEHCLPYRFDENWWRLLRDRNVQSNVVELFQYYRDNRNGVEKFKSNAKREMIDLVRSGRLRAVH